MIWYMKKERREKIAILAFTYAKPIENYHLQNTHQVVPMTTVLLLSHLTATAWISCLLSIILKYFSAWNDRKEHQSIVWHYCILFLGKAPCCCKLTLIRWMAASSWILISVWTLEKNLMDQHSLMKCVIRGETAPLTYGWWKPNRQSCNLVSGQCW